MSAVLAAFAAMARHVCPERSTARMNADVHDSLCGLMATAKREWELTGRRLDAALVRAEEAERLLAANEGRAKEVIDDALCQRARDATARAETAEGALARAEEDRAIAVRGGRGAEARIAQLEQEREEERRLTQRRAIKLREERETAEAALAEVREAVTEYVYWYDTNRISIDWLRNEVLGAEHDRESTAPLARIERPEAAVKAEALREAAEALDPVDGNSLECEDRDDIAGWLRTRADEIEKAGGR